MFNEIPKILPTLSVLFLLLSCNKPFGEVSSPNLSVSPEYESEGNESLIERRASLAEETTTIYPSMTNSTNTQNISQVTSRQEILGFIESTKAAVVSISDDQSLLIVAGLTDPVSIDALAADSTLPVQEISGEGVIFQGISVNSGSLPFTKADILELLDVMAANGGLVPPNPATGADSSGQVSGQEMPVVDLIARGSDGSAYLVEGVNVNALGRDILNTYYNGYWNGVVSSEYQR